MPNTPNTFVLLLLLASSLTTLAAIFHLRRQHRLLHRFRSRSAEEREALERERKELQRRLAQLQEIQGEQNRAQRQLRLAALLLSSEPATDNRVTFVDDTGAHLTSALGCKN